MAQGARWRRSQAYDETIYATMAEMGWTGIIIPEEHGGSDFG